MHAYWVSAGKPIVRCRHLAHPDYSGSWDGTNINVVIDSPVAKGLGSKIGYAAVIAHEAGHAWASAHHVDFYRYAEIRGYPEGGRSVPESWLTEDYADAVALWVRQYATGPTNGPPYGFEVPAGVPTITQLKELSLTGLLPPEQARATRYLCTSRPGLRCIRPLNY